MHRIGLRLTSTNSRASTSTSRVKSPWGTRRLHQRQPLPYSVEEGLGKFLPAEALQVQLEYQDGLLERLNEHVAGTAEAGSSIAQTVINLSGKRDKVLAFNYASLALNNSFFLNNLKPPSATQPTHEDEISTSLASTIRLHHGSVQQLRSAFSAAALGTFLNGWIWFVSDQAGNTGVVSTYGPGTLLIRSRSHMERHPNIEPSASALESFAPARSSLAHPSPPGTTPSSPLSGVSGENNPIAPNAHHLRFYSSETKDFMKPSTSIYSTPKNQTNKTSDMLHAGEILYPLFCVPVYEHAWMSAGYGVWGKEQWLKEFWSVLDWKRVDSAYQVVHSAIKIKKSKN